MKSDDDFQNLLFPDSKEGANDNKKKSAASDTDNTEAPVSSEEDLTEITAEDPNDGTPEEDQPSESAEDDPSEEDQTSESAEDHLTDEDIVESEEKDGEDSPVTSEEEKEIDPETGKPVQTQLHNLVDFNFLQYASYVICERAIPALEDGLKPVQRRILHSLYEKDDGRFIKVANIVGHTMQYHPHGDASINDALVNLSNKRYLIEGQGNFGNIYTGDRAAASRYIECRLTELARNEIFGPKLTTFVKSYDGRNEEPVTLPSKLPLLLMLGTEGIAVGLSTKILPHNFIELLNAQIAILQKKSFEIYPDFIQGGLMDVSEYDRGNGKLKLRADIQEKDSSHLVITQLAYGQTTEQLISSIEDAAKRKKVPIKSIDDFTSEKVEIQLTLSNGATLKKAKQALYAFTACETTVSSHMTVIYGGRPMDTTVDEVLKVTTDILKKILIKEMKIRKQELMDELHKKTLIQLFVEHRIYKRIEQCKTSEAVNEAIVTGLEPFKDQFIRELLKKDIEMLLGIRIRRISLFDINKHKQSIDNIMAELEKIEKNLARPVQYTVRYLKGLIKKYEKDYPRRTEITTFSEIKVRELTATELTINHDKENGYIGHSIEGSELFKCSSLDKIVVVWKTGVYKVMEPPEKFFVDKTMVYCAIYDREKVMTVIYTQDHFTYMKRFKLGGVIMNKEYECTLPESNILFFSDSNHSDIYVKYRKAKGQRIHQQLFHPDEIPVKSAKARGNQMTAKSISTLSTSKPSWWDKDSEAPKGVLFDW